MRSLPTVHTEFSELVAPTKRGRRFRLPMRPGFSDCAPGGRMRLDAIAGWLQDIAYADVEDAGLAQVAAWVVRRTRIRVHRWPRFSERFAVTTYVSGLGRMWAERRTDIVRDGDGAPDVEAVSLWIHLDPIDWHPTTLTDGEIAAYGGVAPERRISARLRHPPPAGAESAAWMFRATELDIAAHINNAAYWQPLEQELMKGDDPEQIDVEIEYRKPALPGVKLVLRDGPHRWIVGEGGEMHASIAVAGGALSPPPGS
jgi:acyl-ACP thioesterase